MGSVQGMENSKSQNLIKIPILLPSEYNSFTNSLLRNGQKQISVQDPFNPVKQNYEALTNTLNKDLQFQSQKFDTDGIQVVHGIVGLKNLGNTCYFNTAIHCLMHTQPLADYFLSRLHEFEINKLNRQGTGGEVAEELANLFIEMWSKQRSVGMMKSENNSPLKVKQPKKNLDFKEFLSPLKLIQVVNKHSKIFKIGCNEFIIKVSEQEDCQELLSYLLDMVHEDLNRAQSRQFDVDDVKSNKPMKDEDLSAESWERHLNTNKSVIVDLFQGQLRSILQCKECGYKVTKFEPYLFLSLPIPKANERDATSTPQMVVQDLEFQENETKDQIVPTLPTLYDCLNLFQERETLKNQWNCPRCKRIVDSQKELHLWKLPNILIIHLKRFEFSKKGGKIDLMVNFPVDQLDLSEHVKGEQKEAPLYSLYAVAQHSGGIHSGHYTAVVRNRNDGQWYSYNDQQVMQVQSVDKLILNNQAYVLFYQKNTSQDFFRQTLTRPEYWPHISKELERKRQIISQGSLRQDSFFLRKNNNHNDKIKKNQINQINQTLEIKKIQAVILEDFLDYDLSNIQSSKNKKSINLFEIKSTQMDKLNSNHK